MSDQRFPSHYTVSKQIVDCILLQEQLIHDLVANKQKLSTM